MENFHFQGFTPNGALCTKAERALDRINERAPLDAVVTASLECSGELFHCRIEIASSSCPLVTETSHKFAAIALDRAELNLLRRLDRWRGGKFLPAERPPAGNAAVSAAR